MTPKKSLCIVSVLVMAALVAGLAVPTWANVYASSMTASGDRSFSYILNENASNVVVEVWQVGGGMVYSQALGAQTKGLNNWNWSGLGGAIGDNYKVKVTASSAGYADWTKISVNQATTNFWLPTGVSVDKNQASANFGKIYVSNGQGGTTGAGTATSAGIYRLNADTSSDLYGNGGHNWGTGQHQMKSTIGEDGHLYVADFIDDTAWEFNDTLTGETQIISAGNRTASQYCEAIAVTGTQAAGNRKIYAVNSNYNDTARKGLIMYDLGSASTASGTGTQYIGPSAWTYYPKDVVRDSAGNWYMNSYRGNQNQEFPIAKFADGTPPINTKEWSASSFYYYSYAVDVYEPYGWAAYVNYLNGRVEIFDINTGAYIGGLAAGPKGRDISFDAAGNIYTVDSVNEWMYVWSPSGANSFTTESWFTVTGVPEPSSLLALLAGLPGLLVFRRRRQ